MNAPIYFTEDQMTAIRRAAEPIQPRDRGSFLQTVAELLRGQVLGDGVVYRAIAQAQRQFYDAPDLTPCARWGRGSI